MTDSYYYPTSTLEKTLKKNKQQQILMDTNYDLPTSYLFLLCKYLLLNTCSSQSKSDRDTTMIQTSVKWRTPNWCRKIQWIWTWGGEVSKRPRVSNSHILLQQRWTTTSWYVSSESCNAHKSINKSHNYYFQVVFQSCRTGICAIVLHSRVQQGRKTKSRRKTLWRCLGKHLCPQGTENK